MKPSLLSTLALALCVSALPLADAAAQDLYVAAFQGGIPLVQDHYTGQSSSNVQFTYNIVTAGPQRLTNIEARHDASGNLVYDTSYNFGSGSHALFMDIPADLVQFHQAGQLVLGRHLTKLTSYLHADGDRRYTALFSGAGGGQDLWMGLDVIEFGTLVDQLDEAPFFQHADVVEVYHDADGLLRFDAAFSQEGGLAETYILMTEPEFESQNTAQENQGRRLVLLETWRGILGNRRYLGRWSSVSPSPFSPVLFLGQDEGDYLATVQAQENLGHALIGLAVLEDIAPAGWTNYGSGLAGTNGVPSLTLDADPFLGANVVIEMGSSAPAPTLCGLFLGLTEAALPFKGGEVLLIPTIDPILLPLATSGLDLPVPMPADPFFDGVELFLQTGVQDAGGPKGYALSRGLKLTLGAHD